MQETIPRVLIVLLVAAIGVLAACFGSAEVAKLTFVNNSDADLCYNRDQPIPESCNKIGPRGTSVWRPDCGDDELARERHITVVLYVAETVEEIYKKSAACREWQDAHATFTIEQSGDEFIVTDNLSVLTPDP